MIERVRALVASARAEPPARRLARCDGNCLSNLANHTAFLSRWILVHPNIIRDAMSKPLPLAFVSLCNDGFVLLADIGVEQHGCPYAMFVENLHHAKNTDARAVVSKRITSDVRQLGAGGTGNYLVNMKEFNIGSHQQGDSCIVRPLQTLAANNGGIVIAISMHSNVPLKKDCR